ncbi:MAG: hypothetical protein WCL29_08920 [Pseudomonadota bacterium]
MLAIGLAAVFLAYCFIMGAVLMFCIRKRRMVDGLENSPPITAETIEVEDGRIVKVLFGAMIAGAVLALITGYLVFFRSWD